MPQVVHPTHALRALAQAIDWEAVTTALRPSYHPRGRYAQPIRVMVGWPLLKPRENRADAQLVQGLQAHLSGRACGGIALGAVLAPAKPGAPCRCVDACTRTTWRNRLGPAGVHVLAAISPPPLGRENVVNGGWMATATTAQAHPLASPTDTAVLDNGRRPLRPLIGTAQAAGVAVA